MASTPSALMRLELQADGENLNTWGQKLNTLFQLVEQAIHSGAEISIPVNANVTLTSTNYIANQERRSVLRFTGTGGYTVTFSGKARKYLIVNDSSGTITLSDGGTTVSLEAGERDIAITDGTDFELMGFSTLNTTLTAYLLKTGGTLTGAVSTNSNITMTGGAFTLFAAPTVDLHASTKKYVDDTAFASLSGVLPGQGGNSGKYLGTNGTNASWNAFPTTLAGYGITDPLLPYTKLSGNITATINNQYAADSTTAARTVTLPAHVENGVVILSDEDGNASVNNAVLSDGTDTWTIDLNYGWIALVSKSGAWKVKARG